MNLVSSKKHFLKEVSTKEQSMNVEYSKSTLLKIDLSNAHLSKLLQEKLTLLISQFLNDMS